MARAPWGSLILLFIAADMVSLYLFWDWVRDARGGGFEAALIVALYVVLAVFVGVWTLRVAGAWSLRGAVLNVARERSPDRDLLNALLALVGGLLIAFPGIASDVVGLALVLPPTRTLARWALARAFRGERARPAGPVEVEEYRVE